MNERKNKRTRADPSPPHRRVKRLVELAPDVKYRYANHAKLLAAINSIPKRQVFPALKYWPLDDLKKQFQNVDRDLIERLPCTRLVKESGHPHLLLWGAAIPVHILRCSGPIKNPKESYYELQFELLIAGYQWSIPAESRKLNVNLQWTKISLPIWMESAQGTYSDRFKVHNLLMQRVPAYSTGLDPTDMFNKTKKKELERHLPSPPHSELPLFEPGNFGLGSSMVSESYLLTIYEQLIILFPEEGIIGIVRDYLSLIYFPGLSEFYKSPDLRVCSSKPAVKFMDTGRIYIPPPPPLPPSVSPPSSSFLFSPTNACFINPFL